jgi:hypothetical protein
MFHSGHLLSFDRIVMRKRHRLRKRARSVVAARIKPVRLLPILKRVTVLARPVARVRDNCGLTLCRRGLQRAIRASRPLVVRVRLASVVIGTVLIGH